MAQQKSDPNYKIIAENRRARFDYAIEDDIECGIILTGSEVKSLRENSSNIAESYAAVEDSELWLVNSYIAPYTRAMFPHEERRRRKLLVSKKELSRLWNETQRKGMTIVPLVMYFNHKGMVKLKVLPRAATRPAPPLHRRQHLMPARLLPMLDNLCRQANRCARKFDPSVIQSGGDFLHVAVPVVIGQRHGHVALAVRLREAMGT